MFQLNVVSAIALWLVATAGPCLYLMPKEAIGWLTGSLLFFNNLNILIAMCEISLGNHIGLIKEDYKKFCKMYRSNEVEAALNFLFMPVPWMRLFDGRIWSRMWSTYALYDPSYQNDESLGFFLDVGNGWTTIPPSVLVDLAIVFPEKFSPVVVGAIGIAYYWQMLYGTVIYLGSYWYNRRYVGFGFGEVLGFVGVSNSLWFFFPIGGLYASYCLLRDGDFSVFRP